MITIAKKSLWLHVFGSAFIDDWLKLLILFEHCLPFSIGLSARTSIFIDILQLNKGPFCLKILGPIRGLCELLTVSEISKVENDQRKGNGTALKELNRLFYRRHKWRRKRVRQTRSFAYHFIHWSIHQTVTRARLLLFLVFQRHTKNVDLFFFPFLHLISCRSLAFDSFFSSSLWSVIGDRGVLAMRMS